LDDTKTTVESLKNLIKNFIEARAWHMFHNPKSMAMQIATEASELMELFLWSETQLSMQQLEKKRTEVEHEVADIAICLLNFCVRCNIDLSKAIKEKMVINAQHYPLAKAKGNAKKYTEL
jgi:dCTP diphosphatase